MDLNETICFCGNVTAGDIKAAVEAGATTLEAKNAVMNDARGRFGTFYNRNKFKP